MLMLALWPHLRLQAGLLMLMMLVLWPHLRLQQAALVMLIILMEAATALLMLTMLVL